MSKPFSRFAWALCLILAGCVSPQDRAEKYPEAFNALTPQQRTLVLAGQIEQGMSEEALIIAYGEPSEIKQGEFEGQPVMGWVYTKIETDTIPRYRTNTYTDASGKVYVSEVYDPMIQQNRVPARVVFVRDGKVAGWQEL